MRFAPTLALALLLTACAAPGTGDGTSSAASSLVSSYTGSNPQALIEVTSPKPGDLVQSPLTVTGRARGNWYFEASFPVKLTDAAGSTIVQHYAQAQGDWMTTDFVPFTTTLQFTTTAKTGFLVLEKDNPSGLPEHAASVSIPVRFE